MSGLDCGKELRSFGRRRGRKASVRQTQLKQDVLPKVAVDLDRIGESLAHTTRPTWIEIGFGGGEHLLWQAKNNPNVSIIGCEPFEDGVVKVLQRIDEDGISNIRLHVGDAREVLRKLPASCAARAFILFPDPWPKRRHKKRRLVNPQTVDLLARILKPKAQVRIATDIGDYARTLLLAFQGESRFRWLAETPRDWRARPADWPATRYEQKAEREGRRRYYFCFERL